MCYEVVYEVRTLGAIGTWSRLGAKMEAKDQESAFQAFRDKYRDTYEFRSPISCRKIDETSP